MTIRITSDELPERLWSILRSHDQNVDGALGVDEVLKAIGRATVSDVLASLESMAALKGVTIADVINDLRLSPAKQKQTLALTKDVAVWPPSMFPESPMFANVRAQLRELLSDEEYENFMAAAMRVPTNLGRIN